MTTTTVVEPATTRGPRGHYGLTNVARMEWIKLRSLRSTRWGLAILAVSTIGFAILVLSILSGHWAPCPRGTSPPSTRPTRASPA